MRKSKSTNNRERRRESAIVVRSEMPHEYIVWPFGQRLISGVHTETDRLQTMANRHSDDWLRGVVIQSHLVITEPTVASRATPTSSERLIDGCVRNEIVAAYLLPRAPLRRSSPVAGCFVKFIVFTNDSASCKLATRLVLGHRVSSRFLQFRRTMEHTSLNCITAAVEMKSAARVTATLPGNRVLPGIGCYRERGGRKGEREGGGRESHTTERERE
ncbi:hypothetical protein LSAT2_018141 [Lamellibrachia satsuma]|nr:hypothetical protein LSAT2_018141 [Lamellibrachia satsuma]